MKTALFRDSPIVKRFSCCKDLLLALQMTQKEVNIRNRIVLTWAARSALPTKAFPPGHLHQEFLGEMPLLMWRVHDNVTEWIPLQINIYTYDLIFIYFI